MQLGTAKLNITPAMPVRLCGYATRTTTFESVKEDIFLRIHIHKDGGTELIYLYADILWWNTDFVQAARKVLADEMGLQAQQLFFVASHNHSGPPTGSSFIPCLETYSEAYAAFLLQQIKAGITAARSNLTYVTLTRYDGDCRMNVYRRVHTQQGIAMLPNYTVEADTHLTILAMRDDTGTVKGLLVHYPCHANLCNENNVQPDYAGVALRLLDTEYPGSVAVFLQGCTADLRPNSVLGAKFTPVNYDKVVAFAEDFTAHCRNVLAGTGIAVTGTLSASRKTAALPFENTKTTAELESIAATAEGYDRDWAVKVLERGNKQSADIEISHIGYGGFDIYTLNAEVSQYYAAFARALTPGAVCAAYTNGMIGYLCTAHQIAHGGYEPQGSALYFALPGTYAPAIENIIHNTIKACKED